MKVELSVIAQKEFTLNMPEFQLAKILVEYDQAEAMICSLKNKLIHHSITQVFNKQYKYKINLFVLTIFASFSVAAK